LMKVKRITDLQKQMRSYGIDAVFLTSEDTNFFYIVQEKILDGFLLLFKTGKPVVFLSPLETLRSQTITVSSLCDVEKRLYAMLKKRSVQNLGINNRKISLHQYQRVKKLVKKTVNIAPLFIKARAIKANQEASIIRQGCKITTKIVNELIKKLKKKQFKTEADIKAFLSQRTVAAGCDFSFDPIVASGKDAAIPHYIKTKKLVRGFLVIDFGIRYKGYCTDMTRTVFLGKPNKKELKIYASVLNAQIASIKFIKKNHKKGIVGKDVDKQARTCLGSLAKYFNHGLGHGLGIDVHEYPVLGPSAGHKLCQGMVFTVEPGYYHLKQRIGIRIEDDIYLGKAVEVLTKGTPKSLMCFPLP